MKLNTLLLILCSCISPMLVAQTHYAKIQQIVDLIVQYSDNANNVKIFVKADSSRTRNAKADIDKNGMRWIIYNPKFVSAFEQNAGTIFAAYALLAHEVGHHVLVGQSFTEKDPNKLKAMELAADEFAGRMLKYPFCATFEEASAGFQNMDQDLSGGHYPPMGARRIAVEQGWDNRDKALKNRGQDPCENISFPLELKEATEYQHYNLRTNPKGIIKGDVLEIEYVVPAGLKIPEFKVYFLKLPTAPYLPQNLLWGADYNKPGVRRLIWEYKKDGFTLNQIKNTSDWYGIGVYNPKFAPEPFPKKVLNRCIACEVAVTGLLATGTYLQIKAWSNYRFYNNNTNPLTYDPPTSQSRADLLQKARMQKNVSFAMLATGLVSSFLCTRTIVIRSKKDQRYKAMDFLSN